MSTARDFGRHVRQLRRARGLTQAQLAQKAGLSADTIRRLESGSFSPGLDTLRKLCLGLDLKLSTLFESFELGVRDRVGEMIGLLEGRSDRDLAVAEQVLRALFGGLDLLPNDPESDP